VNPVTLLYIHLGGLALGTGMLGAWLTVVRGKNWGMLDIPVCRSSHRQPVPKGGGIGILLGFVVSALLLRLPWTFWLSATLVSLSGLWGDRCDIPPFLRLCIQFGAVLILLGGFLNHNGFSGGAQATESFVFFLMLNTGLVLAMAVFVVGTANFYNFMDGINGIAAITGMVAFGLLFFQTTEVSCKGLCLVMTVSCLAFLPFNFPEARVFMGDVGSLLLGFVYAAMLLYIARDLLDFICMTAFLFPFYADELITMSIRLQKHENLMQPHRKHLYQVLVNELGFAHWSVTAGYAILQIMVSVSVLMLKDYGMMTVILLLLFYFSAFSICFLRVRRNIC
jgi:Fuc2NAc and GlcNAc transferase